MESVQQPKSTKERKKNDAVVHASLALLARSVLLWTCMFFFSVCFDFRRRFLQNHNYPELILPNRKTMHLLLLFTLHLTFWSFTMPLSSRSQYYMAWLLTHPNINLHQILKSDRFLPSVFSTDFLRFIASHLKNVLNYKYIQLNLVH